MAMNSDAGRPERGAGQDCIDDDERLPCGRLLSQVWDAQASGTPDAHVRQCPHCTEAGNQLGLLGDAVLQARRTEETAGDARALTSRVMDVVRLELRPGRPLPLGEHDEDLWVMEAMAAKALRTAAETVPGVRAGSCRLIPDDRDGARAPRDPVRVRIEVVVPLTANLQHTADEIRERVYSAASSALGLPVASVDVRIADVTDSADAGTPSGASQAKDAHGGAEGSGHR